MIKCPHCEKEFDAKTLQRDVLVTNDMIVFLIFSCPACKTYLDIKLIP
jgi:formate dehydrogenase maturation protein FdhE